MGIQVVNKKMVREAFSTGPQSLSLIKNVCEKLKIVPVLLDSPILFGRDFIDPFSGFLPITGFSLASTKFKLIKNMLPIDRCNIFSIINWFIRN